jgi:hypothetical protein
MAGALRTVPSRRSDPISGLQNRIYVFFDSRLLIKFDGLDGPEPLDPLRVWRFNLDETGSLKELSVHIITKNDMYSSKSDDAGSNT